MRLGQANYLAGKTLKLVMRALPRFAESRNLINELTVSKNRHEQVDEVCVRRNLANQIAGKIDNHGRFIHEMVDFVDTVGDELAICIAEATNLRQTGTRNFPRIV